MFLSCKRPRDLAIHCGVVLGAFALGCFLCAQLGRKFTHWVAVDKMPELQKQISLEFDKRTNVITGFSHVDFSNVKLNGVGQSGGGAAHRN